MNIAWDRILPVLVSIGVIILVAVLRNYSKTFAAIAAVMPLNIPLGMWIIYAGAEDKNTALIEFNSALLVNIIPTIMFMLVALHGSRAGWPLFAIIGGGYLVWGAGLLVIMALRGA